ncbi:toprim domain-containing protein [Agrobacterium salinitolerans]|uniref:Toprim domain-containing protein n=2 Tax=Agrobacterium salinitolerans TaxID=1183413 RepID=A0A9X3KS00_9HYPH|nr:MULTISPECIES: toprim domain-containing protein [Agrobacterium]MCZ7854680.1 toprim domain-containing protein [Agrobacterium salinitolerans]MCZ7893919.1 toprim domain-containing protein [Agrobacterium salinitolerans]MCZ7939870.1 toprim domain-containing protein [Agrobacterium salinitolerans]
MIAMLSASELADRLSQNAEAVCRHYLSAGRRAGNYWVVGDVANSKGKSLYVHLSGSRKGKWADAATAQYGDLLDLVRETCGLVDFRDVVDEARRFLSLPQPAPASSRGGDARADPPVDRPATERAQRLFRMTQPLAGTLADGYLRQRGILRAALHPALRFHPSCYYRDLVTGRTSSYPALIAAVVDRFGTITGVHRTYLDRSGLDPGSIGKAQVDTPRRALGGLLGNAVHFRFPFHVPVPVMAAGEGLESILSLIAVMPAMPMVSALTANHLAAFRPPDGCERLYIAADADAAGRHGIEGLSRRAQALGILPLVLTPQLGDFNEDLRQLGPDRLIANLRAQLAPEDAQAFLSA